MEEDWCDLEDVPAVPRVISQPCASVLKGTRRPSLRLLISHTLTPTSYHIPYMPDGSLLPSCSLTMAAVAYQGYDLSKLYDKLNLTGKVVRVGQHAVSSGGCANVWEGDLLGTKVAVKVIREIGVKASQMSLKKVCALLVYGVHPLGLPPIVVGGRYSSNCMVLTSAFHCLLFVYAEARS